MRTVRIKTLLMFAAISIAHILAQTEPGTTPATANAIYGGYSLLSNSFNSHSGFRGPILNGWDAAGTFSLTRSLGIKVEGLGFYGNSLGDSQAAHFFFGGGQYTRTFGKESAYVHGMAGIGHIGTSTLTIGGEGPTSNSSFATDAGGGVDTPISKRLAWRVEAAMLFANFTPASDQIHSTPNFFARISTGIAWRF